MLVDSVIESRDGDNLHFLLFVADVGYQLTELECIGCVTERWKIDSCTEDAVRTADSPLTVQRTRGERCRAWTELWMQTESSLLLGSWSPALCCKGCHGDGFNYTASLIAKCSAGKPYKLYSDLIPKVLQKELASVLFSLLLHVYHH